MFKGVESNKIVSNREVGVDDAMGTALILVGIYTLIKKRKPLAGITFILFGSALMNVN